MEALENLPFSLIFNLHITPLFLKPRKVNSNNGTSVEGVVENGVDGNELRWPLFDARICV